MDPATSIVLNYPPLIEKILLFLDYDSILEYCQSHCQALTIYLGRHLWEEKASLDFGTSREVFRETELTPTRRYLQLLVQHGGIARDADRLINPEEFVKRAIHYGRNDLIQSALNSGFNNISLMLREYAFMNDYQTVLYLLSKKSDYQAVAEGALRSNIPLSKLDKNGDRVYQNIFDEILRSVPDYPWNWNRLLVSAVESGSIERFELVRYVASKILPEHVPMPFRFKWTDLASAALKINNQGLFDYIRRLVPENYRLDWTRLGQSAAQSGNIKLFAHLINLIPVNESINLGEMAGSALQSDNRSIFDLIRKMAGPQYQWGWPLLLADTVMSGDIKLFDYVKSLIPSDRSDIINPSVANAALSGNLLMFNHIRSLINKNYQLNWNIICANALSKGNRLFFDYIMKLVPTDYEWVWKELLSTVIESGNILLFNNIKTLIPLDYDLISLDIPIYNAISTGNIELFDQVVAIDQNYLWDWQELAVYALEKGDKEMFDHIKKKAGADYNWDWYYLVSSTFSSGRPQLSQYLLDISPYPDWEAFNQDVIQHEN